MIFNPTKTNNTPSLPTNQVQETSKVTSKPSVNTSSAVANTSIDHLLSISQLERSTLLNTTLKGSVLETAIANPAILNTLTSRLTAEAGDASSKGHLAELLKTPLLRLVKVALSHQTPSPSVNKSTLTALTSLPLKPGDEVVVKTTKDGQLLLVPEHKAQPSVKDAQLQHAIRQTLPSQHPHDQLVDSLNKLIKNPLTDTLGKLLSQLTENLPSHQQLIDVKNVSTAIKNSGVFLESKLAALISQGRIAEAESLIDPAQPRDLKALLAISSQKLQSEINHVKQLPEQTISSPWAIHWQKILSKRQPSAPQLSDKQLQIQLIVALHQSLLAARARVEHHQLSKLASSANNTSDTQASSTSSLQIELPFVDMRQINLLKLYIDDPETKDHKTGKSKAWKLRMSFDINSLGPIYAHLMFWQNHLKVKLWAESALTTEKINNALTNLNERLEEDGVSVDEISCQRGRPANTKNQLNTQLIDVRT